MDFDRIIEELNTLHKNDHSGIEKILNSQFGADKKTILIAAVETVPHCESVNRIRTLESFASPRVKLDYAQADINGNTPLMHAAKLLNLPALKLLLDRMDVLEKSIMYQNLYGETFLHILLKHKVDDAIMYKQIEGIVIELLTFDSAISKIRRGFPLDSVKAPSDMLIKTDDQGCSAFDYLLTKESEKCLTAALGKFGRTGRNTNFRKFVIKCIDDRKFSTIKRVFEMMDGTASEHEISTYNANLDFQDATKTEIWKHFIDAYNSEEELNSDIISAMIYLASFNNFSEVEIETGQSILHKTTQAILPGTRSHEDHLGENIINALLNVPYYTFDVNAQDRNGKTPLMYALENKFAFSGIRDLVNYQKRITDFTLKNNQGKSVFDIMNSMEDIDPHISTCLAEKVNINKQVNITSSLTFKEQIHFMRISVENSKMSDSQKKYFDQQLTCLESDFETHTNARFGSNVGMSELHRRKLIGKRVFLCEELSVDDIYNHLYQEQVINKHQLEAIQSVNLRRLKVELLLSILPLRGENAYDKFIQALRDTNNEFIADELENYNPDINSACGGQDSPLNDLTVARATQLDGLSLTYFDVPGSKLQILPDGKAFWLVPINMSVGEQNQ